MIIATKNLHCAESKLNLQIRNFGGWLDRYLTLSPFIPGRPGGPGKPGRPGLPGEP